MTSLVGQTFFGYLAAVCVVSAILAITRRNPVHSMLWVLALFLHVAGIFLLVGAEFLAAVQVIVYAGAILVFYLFFLMLVDMPREIAGVRFGAHWPVAAAGGLAFAALAWFARDLEVAAITPPGTPAAGGASPGSLFSIGTALFTHFVLPFEIVSLILLAAIVGAVVIAKKRMGD
jgi:NADH-quinone oxidoreductase subunit J